MILPLVGGAQSWGAANPDPPTGSAAVLGDHYPVRRVDFPDGVIGMPDVIYSSLDGFRPLTLDLYLPPSGARLKTQGHPLVIFVHGGGWTNGHSRQSGAFEDWPKVLASLAARGYVVSSLNYRLSREAPFPAAEQDVKSAIRWLRTHAGEFAIDRSRVLVWGGSAGGHLAALTATSCGVAELEPSTAVAAAPSATPAQVSIIESDCVQAAVTWYGVFDFSSMGRQQAANSAAGPVPSPAATSPVDPRLSPNPVVRFLGCVPSDCPPETLRLASPISFVNRLSPPMLLIHGTEDHTVPFAQSQSFYDAMTASGASVRIVPIAGVDHSFVGKTKEQTRQASLEALKETFAFIDATIGSAR
jgi:acetyl esterase/lipase